MQQIAKEFEVHPVQVSDWKRQLQERLTQAFERDSGPAGGTEDFEAERAMLHSKIGQLSVELHFMRKKSKQLGA